MGAKKKSVTVGFVSLGCPKNSVDSERMLAEIVQAGFAITGQTDNADVVIVNTCGFIEPAEAESLEAIRRAVECKCRGTVKKVVVAGCLGKRLGPLLLEKIPEIDAVVGLDQRDNVADIIRSTIRNGNGDRQRCAWQAEQRAERVPDDRTRLLITPGHWAYLRISEGCNRRCSYCTIPAIRGHFRSKPFELVLAEATELASAGVLELNVIAQDTTYYGHDLKIRNGLAALVRELEELAGIEWIRLMYLYPTGIDAELIETIADSGKVVHYLDIPLQHVSATVLRSMRRPGNPERLRRIIENLRDVMPDIILRTTLMVGFPGETDREFAELVDFVGWARFDALGCFQFYAESGTAAAEMPAQVPEEVKQQRLEELMLTQQKIAFAKNQARIGSELRCLVDSVDSGGRGCARFYGQAPGIDSICIIGNCRAQAGQFINAKVISSSDYDLRMEQV